MYRDKEITAWCCCRTKDNNYSYEQVEVFAEIGEIISGTKQLPKVPDCGKKFIVFKSLGTSINHRTRTTLVHVSLSPSHTHTHTHSHTHTHTHTHTGMAVEDVVSAKLVYDRYLEKQRQAKQ